MLPFGCFDFLVVLLKIIGKSSFGSFGKGDFCADFGGFSFFCTVFLLISFFVLFATFTVQYLMQSFFRGVAGKHCKLNVAFFSEK